MTILAWLFGILAGAESARLWTQLWSLLARLMLASLLFAAVVLTPGCSAPSSTPISTVSGPTIVTRDGASPVPSTAQPSPPQEYATGSALYQPGSSPSHLPLIFSLSPIDWIVFTALSGSSGGLAGGALGLRAVSRRSKLNGA